MPRYIHKKQVETAVRDRIRGLIGKPKVESDLNVERVELKEGSVDIRFVAGGPESERAILLMADAMGKMLDEHDAPNYVESVVSKRGKPRYIMRIQRFEKPTPHELRVTAEAERDRALADLAEVARQYEEYERAFRVAAAERAEAWDKGWSAGLHHATWVYQFPTEPDKWDLPEGGNPYRDE